MRRLWALPPAILVSLALFALRSESWSSEASYPRYEPPNLEDLPIAPPSTAEGETGRQGEPETGSRGDGEQNLSEGAAASPAADPERPQVDFIRRARPEEVAPATEAVEEMGRGGEEERGGRGEGEQNQAADSSPSLPVPQSPRAPVAQSQPRPFKTYKVWIWQENGDTLWRIAQKVYGDKDKWPLIYKANRDIIKDPNKIYPKQKLRIPPPDWQP